MSALYVFLGGGLGATCRHLLGNFIQSTHHTAFPLGTFAVNLIGSFSLGLFIAVLSDSGVSSSPLKLFIATGFLGGFTTYSTFNSDLIHLIELGKHPTAALYLLSTLGVCLLGGIAGLIIGRWIN